jgi:hypothetical protein
MILPAQEIRRRCALPAPMISPFVERDVVPEYWKAFAPGQASGLAGSIIGTVLDRLKEFEEPKTDPPRRSND